MNSSYDIVASQPNCNLYFGPNGQLVVQKINGQVININSNNESDSSSKIDIDLNFLPLSGGNINGIINVSDDVLIENQSVKSLFSREGGQSITKLSQLTNDVGYISSYTQTDPIYLSQRPYLALKTQVPTKNSQLINDTNYISSYTQTDPVFASLSSTFATTAQLDSVIAMIPGGQTENQIWQYGGVITSGVDGSSVTLNLDFYKIYYLNINSTVYYSFNFPTVIGDNKVKMFRIAVNVQSAGRNSSVQFLNIVWDVDGQAKTANEYPQPDLAKCSIYQFEWCNYLQKYIGKKIRIQPLIPNNFFN